MEKVKLINKRKERKISQNMIADKLFMDVSCYNRREKGLSKITLQEWEKLADILDVPLDEIYESEDSQVFICKDNSTVQYTSQGTNNIFSVPEHLLETQRKYIEILEKQINELKKKK
jgi:transcriptional regulator with XRE-family HTH domain